MRVIFSRARALFHGNLFHVRFVTVRDVSVQYGGKSQSRAILLVDKDVHEVSNAFVFVFKFVFEGAPIWLKFAHNHCTGLNEQHKKYYAHTYDGLAYRGQNRSTCAKNGVPHNFFPN